MILGGLEPREHQPLLVPSRSSRTEDCVVSGLVPKRSRLPTTGFFTPVGAEKGTPQISFFRLIFEKISRRRSGREASAMVWDPKLFFVPTRRPSAIQSVKRKKNDGTSRPVASIRIV